MDRDILKDKILSIIKASNTGVKASTIAEKLNVDRREVNSLLYGNLKSVCNIDSDYKWHIIPSLTEYTQGDVVSWFKNEELCLLFLKLYDYQKEFVENVVIDIRENLIGCKVPNERLRFYVLRDELCFMFKTKNSEFIAFQKSNLDIMKNDIEKCFYSKQDYTLKTNTEYQSVKFTENEEAILNIDLSKLKNMSRNGKIKFDDVINCFGNAICDPAELDKICSYLEKSNIAVLF